MAHNMKTLWSLGKGVINTTLFRNAVLNAFSRRLIFTPAALKIGDYERERHLTRAQYMAVEDTFREKMRSICDTEKGKLYMEDLKAMLYIAQSDDVPLLISMIEKYNINEQSRFVFGPVIMRALYFVDDVQAAVDLYNRPHLSHLFNTQTAQTIFMTLLYNHAMYDTIIDVWNKSLETSGLPMGSKSARIIMFASLAKQGTNEALEMARSVWQKMKENNTFITRELPLYIHLLLQCQQPEEALTELEQTRAHSKSNLHMKILALLQLQKYDDIPQLLENAITDTDRRSLIFRDMPTHLATIPETIEAKPRILRMYQSLPRSLKGEHTLEKFIYSPIRTLTVTGQPAIGGGRQERRTTFREKLLSQGL